MEPRRQGEGSYKSCRFTFRTGLLNPVEGEKGAQSRAITRNTSQWAENIKRKKKLIELQKGNIFNSTRNFYVCAWILEKRATEQQWRRVAICFYDFLSLSTIVGHKKNFVGGKKRNARNEKLLNVKCLLYLAREGIENWKRDESRRKSLLWLREARHFALLFPRQLKSDKGKKGEKVLREKLR